MEPNEHKRIQAEKIRIAEDPATIKREFFDMEGNKISRKLSKKLKRLYRRPTHQSCTTKNQRNLELCSIDLINPVVKSIYFVLTDRSVMFYSFQGQKCAFKLCKICCRDKCYTENVDCVGHKFLIEKRRGYVNNTSNDNSTFNNVFSKNELPYCT